MSTLTNRDIEYYVSYSDLPYFRGMFMRDMLPKSGPWNKECGIINLNTSQETGSHWTCYYKDDRRRIYFDSFGQITPTEIQKYLKTNEEQRKNLNVIQRNTDIVQNINTSICGHLCIMVLEGLTSGLEFQDIINILRKRFHDGYS